MRKRAETRKRDAASTREAILSSARRTFARSGYDGVGVREIAAGAGVTAMLVNRYFGSKEKLFAEAVAASMDRPTILSRENLKSPRIAQLMAEALVIVTDAENDPLEGFQILFKSISSKGAARIGRKAIEDGHQKAMTEVLKGNLVSQRAAILLALIGGFQMMRQMLGLSALAKADPEDLVKVLTSVFKVLIDGK